MLAPESARMAPSSTSCERDSAGCALSMCIELISSSMPPPTWNEASEIPKNSSTLRPARALVAMTTKAVKAATRAVFARCARLRLRVKWMKNGITPTGLTIASSVISGLIGKSMAGRRPGWRPDEGWRRTQSNPIAGRRRYLRGLRVGPPRPHAQRSRELSLGSPANESNERGMRLSPAASPNAGSRPATDRERRSTRSLLTRVPAAQPLKWS